MVNCSCVLDCSWQLCPVPILMTEEKMKALKRGSILEVIFTDPGAKPDLEAWCGATGNELMGFKNQKIKSSAFIRKGKETL
ncbi:MAG: sulfurtransferase TusA family protein [Candidatus Omnitrophica bacterium]|nr:sulfurtransferase TusA family protein [Candidatus Omnitrophota bacterium]